MLGTNYFSIKIWKSKSIYLAWVKIFLLEWNYRKQRNFANFKQLYFTYSKFKLGQICVHFEVSYIYFSTERVSPKNSLWCKIYGQKLITSSFWACHNLVVFMQFLNRDSTFTQQYYWYNLIFDNKVHSLHFSCYSSFYKRAFILWHIMLVIPQHRGIEIFQE